MLRLVKKKISVVDAAALMARVVLKPLEAPSTQDLSFREQAVLDGNYKTCFIVEVTVLEIFVRGAIINREKLEGRMKPETAQSLVSAFIRSVHKRLENASNDEFQGLTLNATELLTLIDSRTEAYYESVSVTGSFQEVPRLFAQFCGDHQSDTLHRLGSSILLARGNAHGEWLRSLKIS